MSRDDDFLEELNRRVSRDLREGKNSLSKIKEYACDHWVEVAGTDLATSMLASRGAAEQCLDHADLRIRLVALSVLVLHWKLHGRQLRTEAVERLWRDLAGPERTELMLRSPDAAKAYLLDPDINVSNAASSILANYWDIPIGPALLQRIADGLMGRKDPERGRDPERGSSTP